MPETKGMSFDLTDKKSGITATIDWKSDVEPTDAEIETLLGQMRDSSAPQKTVADNPFANAPKMAISNNTTPTTSLGTPIPEQDITKPKDIFKNVRGPGSIGEAPEEQPVNQRWAAQQWEGQNGMLVDYGRTTYATAPKLDEAISNVYARSYGVNDVVSAPKIKALTEHLTGSKMSLKEAEAFIPVVKAAQQDLGRKILSTWQSQAPSVKVPSTATEFWSADNPSKMQAIDNAILTVMSAPMAVASGVTRAITGANMQSIPDSPTQMKGGLMGLVDNPMKNTLNNSLDFINGLAQSAFGLIPDVAALNTVVGLTKPLASSAGDAVGGSTGKSVAEGIIDLGSALAFGPKMALMVGASVGGSKLTEKLLEGPLGEGLTDKNKSGLIELSGHVGFGLAMGAGHGVQKINEYGRPAARRSLIKAIDGSFTADEFKALEQRVKDGKATNEDIAMKNVIDRILLPQEAYEHGATVSAQSFPNSTPRWLIDYAMGKQGVGYITNADIPDLIATRKAEIKLEMDGLKQGLAKTELSDAVKVRFTDAKNDIARLQKELDFIDKASPKKIADKYNRIIVDKYPTAKSNEAPKVEVAPKVEPVAEVSATKISEPIKEQVVPTSERVQTVLPKPATVDKVETVEQPLADADVEALIAKQKKPVVAENATPEQPVVGDKATPTETKGGDTRGQKEEGQGLLATGEPVGAVEPWQMTKSAYVEKRLSEPWSEKAQSKSDAWKRNEKKIIAGASESNHQFLVEEALKAGRDVPPEVLADYPGMTERVDLNKILARQHDEAVAQMQSRENSNKILSINTGKSVVGKSAGKSGEMSAMSVNSALPLNPKVKAQFAESDLNNVVTLRQIGKTLADNLGKTVGKDVRFGLIKRFTHKAQALFFKDSGIIRLKNINDLNSFTHEIGHDIDATIFKLQDQLQAKKTPTSLKHRAELRRELKAMLTDQGYPKKNLAEGIAEFVRNYVINPEYVINKTPKFHQFFEGLLAQNEPLAKALKSARGQVKEFGQQDPRQIIESTIARPEKKSWVSGIVEDFKSGNAYYNLVSMIKPLRDIQTELRKMDPNLKGENDPLLQMLSTLGTEGKMKQYLENHPFQRSGSEISISDKPGLLTIFHKMIVDGSLKSHEGFLVALRNIELHNTNRAEAATTAKDVSQQVVDLFEKQHGKEYADKLVKDLREYNTEILTYYLNSGKISKPIFDQIQEMNQFYVPFKRFFDEYETTGSINSSKILKDAASSPVKAIKGSSREVMSPVEGLFQNTYEVIHAADMNDALRTIVKSLGVIDKANVQEIPRKVMKAAYVVGENGGEVKWSIAHDKPKNMEIVTVWDKGEPKFYQIPKEYYDPLFKMSQPYSTAIKWLAAPVQVLRAGAVVYDPTFGFRNVPRDQSTGFFYSKYGYMPFYHFAKGIFSASKNEAAYQKFLASGADISFLADTPAIVKENIHNGATEGHLSTWKTRYLGWNGAFKLAHDFGRATELGTRVGSFKNAYLKTGDVYKAMQESRDIGGDYAIQSAAIKGITPIYAFLNARIRHAENIGRSFSAENLPNTMKKGMLAVAPVAILNWFANNMDEDRKKLYKELPAWRRNTMFNIPIPGTETFLPVPKGFYGVLFGTSVEGILDWAADNDPEVIKSLAGNLLQEWSPISNPMQIVPTTISPLVEQWANKSAFSGKPIVSASLSNLPPTLQYDDSTPAMVKILGEKTGISPKRIEAFVRGYTAGMGSNIMNVSDEVLSLAGIIEKKEDAFTRLGKLPITKAFFVSPPVGTRGASVEKFYEKLDDLEKLNNAVNHLVTTENADEAHKYLVGNEKDYKWYLQNSKEINKYKELLRSVRELQSQLPKDQSGRDAIKSMNAAITETSRGFQKAYQEGTQFSIYASLSDVLKKVKTEDRQDSRELKKFKTEIKNGK